MPRQRIKPLYGNLRYTFCILSIWAFPIFAQDVTGDLNTNIQDSTVDSNNATENTTNNYNAAGAGRPSPVPSAMGPTVMGGGGNDSCLIPDSTGVTISIMSVSRGKMQQDPECNRRKDARLLGTPQAVGGLGLQVSGISVMCNNPKVFKAMLLANTPCPVFDVSKGALAMGKDAIDLYRSNPSIFVVNYDQERAYYDALLMIGQEIEYVQETNVDAYEPLSVRFRSARAGRGPRQDYQLDKLTDSN
jgi:hypothetical protein